MQFALHFVKALQVESGPQVELLLNSYMQRAKVSRATRTTDKLSLNQQQTRQQLQSELESEQSGRVQPLDLEHTIETFRRAATLTVVYREFDLGGNGGVSEQDLLTLGRMRRKLGQITGNWTAEDNKKMFDDFGGTNAVGRY